MPSELPQTTKSYTAAYMLVAFLLGIVLLFVAISLKDKKSFTYEPEADELLKEFAIVLISVCGVSLFYERVLAERHFHKFHAELQELIRQGETNSAVCARMGVMEIFHDRSLYATKHSFPNGCGDLAPGDVVRVIGRSLYFMMLDWEKFQPMLRAGASLEICMIDPALPSSPLDYLACYEPLETTKVVNDLRSRIKSWLEANRPSGSLEVRFHQVHLLDSVFDIKRQGSRHISWDLNFGRGLTERRIFYVDGNRPFGRDLTLRRYDLLWNNSAQRFLYRNGKVEVDSLPAPPGPAEVGHGAPATL